MIKVAIVTWTKWNNYGTILQSYALYKFISNIGYDVKVLDDRYITSTKCVEEFGRTTPWDYFKNKIKSYLKYKNGFEKLNNNRERQCDKEKRRIIKYHLKNVRYESLHKLNNEFDIFICGSDQIWTPNNVFFDPYYFLGFVNKRKISYAPSIGVSEYHNDKKEIVKSLLSTFDAISVREDTGKNIIAGICRKDVTVCIDPTLLFDEESWKKDFAIETNKEEYAICYFLGEEDWYRDKTINFCNKEKIKLISIPMFKKDLNIGDEHKFVAPSKFLELFANAKYVFTDSYHGMLFAITFHRNVFVFSRFKKNDILSQNSRIEDFVKNIGLSNRYIKDDSSEIPSDSINYHYIDNKINELRVHSYNYLVSALKENKNE